MFTQVAILFLLMGLGYALSKGGVLREEGVDQCSWLLCNVVCPCIIFTAFEIKYTSSMLSGLIWAMVASFGVNLGSVFVSRLLFNKKTVPQEQKRMVLQFSTIFTNSGFMGYPLLQGVAGSNGLFYGAAYNAVYNLFTWSYGLMLYRGRINLREFAKALANPNIVATFLGVICFRFSLRLPDPVNIAAQDVSSLNTPLSMIIIGTSLARVPLHKIFTGVSSWFMVFLRNLALPVATMFLLHAAGLHGVLLLCCVLIVGCPVAGVTVIFAKLTGRDSDFPARLVALTTLLSLVTLPTVAALMRALQYM